MDILKISGIAILIITLSTVLKQTKPEFSIMIIIFSSVLIFSLIFGYVEEIYITLADYFLMLGINNIYINIIFKTLVIAYLSEFTSSLCRDSGESALSVKIELAGKVVIMTLAIPLIKELLTTITKMAV